MNPSSAPSHRKALAQLQKILRLVSVERILRLELPSSLLQCVDAFALVQVFRGFGRFALLWDDFTEVIQHHRVIIVFDRQRHMG